MPDEDRVRPKRPIAAPLGWGVRIGGVAGIAWGLFDSWGRWSIEPSAALAGEVLGRTAFGALVGFLVGRLLMRKGQPRN